jgi:hypothetical protein
MEEWTNLWIVSSTQSTITEDRTVLSIDPETGERSADSESFSDWAINFIITARWNPEYAIWGENDQEASTAGGSQQ